MIITQMVIAEDVAVSDLRILSKIKKV